MTPGRGSLRAARGLSLALACLALPAGAHVVAGGGVPSHGPFLFGAALLAIACVAWAERRRSTLETAAMLMLTQPVLHVLLALSEQAPMSVVPTSGMVAAHVIAAVLLTILLAGSEALLWSFSALARTVVVSAARRLTDYEPSAPAVVRSPVYAPPGLALRHELAVRANPRRGPPVVVMA